MRLLVIGAKGMLGTDLMEELRPPAGEMGHVVVGVDLEEVDITDSHSVRALYSRHAETEMVVNCAAYTNVDRAESEPDLAFAVNALGVANLSRECAHRGMALTHISTDYVFNGRKAAPYREDDPTAPLGVYGKSKLEGEERLADELAREDYLLIRTQWLYGRAGANFVTTMLRLASERGELAVVDDQIGRPTWTASLARGIHSLVEGGRRGIYHVANRGEVSWHGFASAILERAGVRGVRVRAIPSTELVRPASRPLNSILSLDRFERDCPPLSGWQDALDGFLSQIGRLAEARETLPS